MKKILSAVAVLAMCGSAYAASEGVATVSGISGKVLVNQGEGFVALSDGMTLMIGDQVLVGQESLATVSYKDCTVAVSQPSVHVVSATPNCANGVAITPTADVDYVAPTVFPYWILVGGGVTVLTGCYVAGCFEDENNNPATPAAP